MSLFRQAIRRPRYLLNKQDLSFIRAVFEHVKTDKELSGKWQEVVDQLQKIEEKAKPSTSKLTQATESVTESLKGAWKKTESATESARGTASQSVGAAHDILKRVGEKVGKTLLGNTYVKQSMPSIGKLSSSIVSAVDAANKWVASGSDLGILPLSGKEGEKAFLAEEVDLEQLRLAGKGYARWLNVRNSKTSWASCESRKLAAAQAASIFTTEQAVEDVIHESHEAREHEEEMKHEEEAKNEAEAKHEAQHQTHSKESEATKSDADPSPLTGESSSSSAQNSGSSTSRGELVVAKPTVWERMFGEGSRGEKIGEFFSMADASIMDTELSLAVREMKQNIDPSFDINDLHAEFEHIVAPLFVKWYLGGDETNLLAHSGSGAFAAMVSGIKARKKAGGYLESTMLAPIENVALSRAFSVAKNGIEVPWFLYTFSVQQINCMRKIADDSIIEGRIDDIRNVRYAIVVRPAADRNDPILCFPWQIVEVAIVGNQPII